MQEYLPVFLLLCMKALLRFFADQLHTVFVNFRQWDIVHLREQAHLNDARLSFRYQSLSTIRTCLGYIAAILEYFADGTNSIELHRVITFMTILAQLPNYSFATLL